MRRLALALLLLLSSGCGDPDEPAPEPAARTECRSIAFAGARALECPLTAGGEERRYVLVQPERQTDEPGRPTVIVLHGVGGPLATPEATAEASLLHRLGPERDFAVVFADGDGDGYFSALLDDVVERHGADPRRRFVAGWSGGGFTVHRLACRFADRIAAIAVLHAPLRGRCAPAADVAVLQLTGHDDPFIPVEGGRTPDGTRSPPVTDAMARWDELTQADVEWIDKPGAGHDWFPDATRRILRFFADHPRFAD